MLWIFIPASKGSLISDHLNNVAGGAPPQAAGEPKRKRTCNLTGKDDSKIWNGKRHQPVNSSNQAGVKVHWFFACRETCLHTYCHPFVSFAHLLAGKKNGWTARAARILISIRSHSSVSQNANNRRPKWIAVCSCSESREVCSFAASFFPVSYLQPHVSRWVFEEPQLTRGILTSPRSSGNPHPQPWRFGITCTECSFQAKLEQRCPLGVEWVRVAIFLSICWKVIKQMVGWLGGW